MLRIGFFVCLKNSSIIMLFCCLERSISFAVHHILRLLTRNKTVFKQHLLGDIGLVDFVSLGILFASFRGKGSGRTKGNYSLSLICLHIFLLFSVCTRRPSFFAISCSIFFTKIVLMSSFCTNLRISKCSHTTKYALLSIPRFTQK